MTMTKSERRGGPRAGDGMRAGGPSSVVALSVLFLAALLAWLPGEASAQASDFEWSGTLSEGEVLDVFGVNGSVEAEDAGGSRASVRAEKRGRRSDPSEVRIEVVEHDDGVTICAVYPGRGNDCEAGDHESRVRDNDVRVDFTVRVPAGVRFRGRTVNGDVRVRDLEGDVEARSVNGDVEVSTRGTAEARTVNGDVHAAMGRSPEHPLELHTVNGGIELDLPDDADVDVEAEWVNGGLESDLPFHLVGRISRHRAEGRLGDGGPLLKLTTVNGSISIR